MTEDIEKIKEISVPTKFNPATQKYEPDMEKLDEKVKEFKKEHSKEIEVREKERKRQEELAKTVDNKDSPASTQSDKRKEGSFRPIIFIMLASLLIAYLWDKLAPIKKAVHFVLDPSAGSLLNWNLNVGMLIIVLLITVFTTIIQKYATDQKALKEIKKEQKDIQKQIKEFKHDPKKAMELQKQQMKLMPKQMKLSMRAVAYTGIPFIILFRWFNDYFASIIIETGEPIRFWLGMSWFVFYLLGAIIFGSILRKQLDVV